MGYLAPHGGCNWEGCEECFPAWSGRPKRKYARLHIEGWPSSEVEIIEWSEPHEQPIPGYSKVQNVHKFMMVVANSRLTDHHER